MISYIQTVDEFDKIIAKGKEENKVVLVNYTASWCGPCKMIAPTFEKMADAADSSRIEFYKVDVDDASEIAHKAKVTSMPTFRAYNGKNQDGDKDYAEQKGAIPTKLEKLIKESLEGATA